MSTINEPDSVGGSGCIVALVVIFVILWCAGISASTLGYFGPPAEFHGLTH